MKFSDVGSISHEELLALVFYDPDTGLFVRDGKVIGTEHSSGYVYLRLKGHCYKAHRLAWFYVNGVWPKERLDHKDRNRANNQIDNLREATASLNRANSGIPAHNTTGVKGVVRSGGWKRPWTAQISINGEAKYLGSFRTMERAARAYSRAARAAFGEFANPERSA
jgi:Demerecviridae HNH endonuclease